MRVLVLSNMYPSAAEPGYGSFVQRQVDRLTREHDVEVKLVVSYGRGGGSANLGKYAQLLWRVIVATARGGYDVVHAHYLLPTAAFSLIPAVVRRKPLVITAHGTDIYTGTWRGWKSPITRALRRACRIIVVSEFLAERLTENFGVAQTPGCGFVIANMGVDAEKFTPGDTAGDGATAEAGAAAAGEATADDAAKIAAKSAAKLAQNVPTGIPHLLFVGNFVEQKGVTDLARALVELDTRGVDFRATLLGHGPDDSEVRATVAPLGEKVRFKMPVPHGQLVEVFRSADLFVLPSRREGVGLLVCLESLACGVPVACGRAGGLPELVREGVNGALFEPNDPVGMADKLQRLLGDPEELARLASAARLSALPYSESEQAEKVFRVYEECAGRQ
jgi:glycosyltransferase involved in cell wall biosynthesis